MIRAVSVTTVPLVNALLHVLPQLMPPGLLVTVPFELLELFLVTVSVNVAAVPAAGCTMLAMDGSPLLLPQRLHRLLSEEATCRRERISPTSVNHARERQRKLDRINPVSELKARVAIIPGHIAGGVVAFEVGVSMPLAWDDPPKLKSGAEWTIANAREHLLFQTSDPWAEYWKKKQTLKGAMKNLALNR
jgi:hypothetical protein